MHYSTTRHLRLKISLELINQPTAILRRDVFITVFLRLVIYCSWFVSMYLYIFLICVSAADLKDDYDSYKQGVIASKNGNYDEAIVAFYRARQRFLKSRNKSVNSNDVLSGLNKHMLYASMALYDQKDNKVIKVEYEESLYTEIFRKELKYYDRDELSRQAGIKKNRVFLGIHGDKGLADPPDGVINSLSDMDIAIHLYSEIVSLNNKLSPGVDDNNTSTKAKTLISVRIIGWVSDNEIIVAVYSYNSPLAGGGCFVVYVKDGIKWEEKERLINWQS